MTMAASHSFAHPEDIKSVEIFIQGFERLGYVADKALATAIYLTAHLRKPLLIEGHAGLGKTEVAKALSSLLGARLIRLQCYEGLDAHAALYEWNYVHQLLAIKLFEQDARPLRDKEQDILS